MCRTLHPKLAASRGEVGKVGKADASRFHPVCIQPDELVAVAVLRRVRKIKGGKLERQVVLVVMPV